MTDWVQKVMGEMEGKKYSADQPRVPAGSSAGGQFTSSGGTLGSLMGGSESSHGPFNERGPMYSGDVGPEPEGWLDYQSELRDLVWSKVFKIGDRDAQQGTGNLSDGRKFDGLVIKNSPNSYEAQARVHESGTYNPLKKFTKIAKDKQTAQQARDEIAWQMTKLEKRNK